MSAGFVFYRPTEIIYCQLLRGNLFVLGMQWFVDYYVEKFKSEKTGLIKIENICDY